MNSQKCNIVFGIILCYIFPTLSFLPIRISPFSTKMWCLNLVTALQQFSTHSQVLFRNIENGSSQLVNEIKLNGAVIKVLAPGTS